MTTFQDPPPHSRRAVRQSERGENPDAQANFAQFTGDQPVAPAENPAEGAENAVAEPFAGPAPTGRRARAAAPDDRDAQATTPPQAEPLNYATQGGASTSAHEPWAQPSTHAQAPEQAYRVRDFSPEGRRTASAPQQPQPWATTPGARPTEGAAPLEYRTQAAPPRLPVPAPETQQATPPAQVTTPPAQVTSPPSAFLPPAAQAPQVPVHAVPAPASPEPQTMSRREMRALLAQQEAAAASAAPSVPPLVEPVAPSSASALSNAMAEFEALTRARTAPAEQPELAADQTTPPAEQTTPPVRETDADEAFSAAAEAREAQDERARVEFAEREAADQARQQAEHESQAEAVRHAELRAEEERQEQARRAEAADTERAEALHAATLEANALANAQTERDAAALVAESQVQLAPQFVEPEVTEQPFSSAAGHWSRQGELDDETQPYENTLSREVGGSNIATTTSALVLPVIPAPDFSTAIGNTGDILVTGSIDLPRSLGTTGGDARRYDDPDVDNLFDAFDNEIISTDSAPVRAIRAVSTHTSTHGVLANAQPKTSRLLPILLGTTVVLAAAVVTLLVVAFVNGMF
ncbi:hypothetical protein EYE40_06260 [Glaciihabitans arcticus]|uniref:Uncharacterized protein n=1 Tax=Glaciihabitans arcticus TaxID=2668039 RepID=A0A4Q9GSC7_9MICO|nr:hypothetical protein [Glaciihabitans arcticus]TBN57034.1 hypothetical protein EYE40_06260 [Glaciihabitans arcticus]